MTFDDVGIEVLLPDPEAFLKIVETLSRIGIASRKDKKLYQSVHILHKKGLYKIVHFKELFQLDGRETNFSEEDLARRNTIANLLAEWDLVNLINPEKSSRPTVSINQIKILPFKEKNEWDLIVKYTVGRPK